MSVWIFGYGSLLFRPDFPSAPARPALARGYARRFYQGSPDHRGTPERLGRVVTLVPEPGAEVWGAVFEVADVDSAAVLAHLDYRERGGYERLMLDVALRDETSHTGEAVRAVTWVAARDNPYFLGPAPMDELIAQVAEARGPSGPNAEYVLRLAETLRGYGVEDPHVFEIERALRGRNANPRSG